MNRIILFVIFAFFLFSCNNEKEIFVELEEEEAIVKNEPVTRAFDYGTPMEPKYLSDDRYWDPKEPVGYPHKEHSQYPGWGLTGINWPEPDFQVNNLDGKLLLSIWTANREEQEYNLYFGQYIHLMWREYDTRGFNNNEWYIYNPDKLKSKELYDLWVTVDPHRQRYADTYIDASVMPRGTLELRFRKLSDNKERKPDGPRENASLWSEYKRWYNPSGYQPGSQSGESPSQAVLVYITAITDINIHCPVEKYYYTLREPNGHLRERLTVGSYEVMYTTQMYMKVGYAYEIKYTVSVNSTSGKSISKTFTEDVFIREDSTEFIELRNSEDFFFDDWK